MEKPARAATCEPNLTRCRKAAYGAGPAGLRCCLRNEKAYRRVRGRRGWGEGGHVRVRRGANTCGVASNALYVVAQPD